MAGLKEVVKQAGFEIERASYVNLSFFAPIFFGRLLMRVTVYVLLPKTTSRLALSTA